MLRKNLSPTGPSPFPMSGGGHVRQGLLPDRHESPPSGGQKTAFLFPGKGRGLITGGNYGFKEPAQYQQQESTLKEYRVHY